MHENVLFFLKGPLSQWHRSEFKAVGKNFVTAEQFMMYMKAMIMNDVDTAAKILETESPSEQKKLGRQVKNFDGPTWDMIKEAVVAHGNIRKFLSNPDLKEYLLSTGDKQLVEVNPKDSIWGIGMDEETAMVTPEEEWNGENLLGKCLMEVRDILRKI